VLKGKSKLDAKTLVAAEEIAASDRSLGP